MKRVVITGRGALSAAGMGIDVLENLFRTGQSVINPLAEPLSSKTNMPMGAPVDLAMLEGQFDRRQLPQLDTATQFSMLAAREAIASSGLEADDPARTQTGVIIGSGLAAHETLRTSCKRIYGEQASRLHPMSVAKGMSSALPSQVAMEHGLKGPSFAVSSACASANHAIGQAFGLIRAGMATAMLAGGTEYCFSRPMLMSWDALRVVSIDNCRPFSADRSGLILGEGSGMLLLEEREHALARGAVILGEIAGFGMSSDAGDILQPDQNGMERAMIGAVEMAEITPDAIGYINAHGTGTQLNDKTETAAIHHLFGRHAKNLLVSSTKSLHGHALGGSGALEAMAVLHAFAHDQIAPTANYRESDPECDLDYVPNEARAASVEYALSNSFAFCGLNASLLFCRGE